MSFTPQFGYIYEPAEITATNEKIREAQGYIEFSQIAQHLMAPAQTTDVMFWELEQLILGKVLGSWNQNDDGTGEGGGFCVSFGWGRAAQDCLLVQIAKTPELSEGWPGAEVATEPIYGGSRVEVGGGRIGGDGSVGAWAAKWCGTAGGILLRKVYGSHDLSRFNTKRSRDWGRSGVPDEIEPEARLHPVKGVALVQTPEEAVAALRSWKPIAICGSTSRTMKRRPGGWCPKTGNAWAHCEQLAGVVDVAGGANSPFGGDGAAPYAGTVTALVERNSWGGYLGNENALVKLASGREITLPEGVYLSTLEERAADFRQQDTFALSDTVGWKATTLDQFY